MTAHRRVLSSIACFILLVIAPYGADEATEQVYNWTPPPKKMPQIIGFTIHMSTDVPKRVICKFIRYLLNFNRFSVFAFRFHILL